jgi:adenine-specific DNA-methyltransferase
MLKMNRREKQYQMTRHDIKDLGQYFTPPIVASFMTKLISTNSRRTARILEPCAGEGVFLRELKKQGYNNVVAYEIDPNLTTDLRSEIIVRDFLSTDPNDKFDVVIGNPPYVRWKNILDQFKSEFRTEPYWKAKLNGLGDLLYAFIFLSVDKLNPGGELIFITPRFWTETLHSRMVRKWLAEVGEIELILTFNEMRIFSEVSSAIMIFKFVKRKTGRPIRVIHLHSKAKLTNPILESVKIVLGRLDKGDIHIQDGIFEGYTIPQFENGNPWLMIPPDIKPTIEKIEQTCIATAPIVGVTNSAIEYCSLSRLLENEDLERFEIERSCCKTVKYLGKSYYLFVSQVMPSGDLESRPGDSGETVHRYSRLGDICHIGNGLVSGLDGAFRVDSDRIYNANEKAKIIPVLKAKDLRKYLAPGFSKYLFANDVATENELKKGFPNIHRHLSRFRTALEKRYQYSGTIPWWHWVFLRNFDLIAYSEEKIFVPCKERVDHKGYVRFSLSRGTAYATQDVTVIVKKREVKEDIRFILGILNSDLILNWLMYKGLRRGGVLEFSERPLARIPLRLIDWTKPQDVEAHSKITSLVDAILKGAPPRDHQKAIENTVRQLYRVS